VHQQHNGDLMSLFPGIALPQHTLSDMRARQRLALDLYPRRHNNYRQERYLKQRERPHIFAGHPCMCAICGHTAARQKYDETHMQLLRGLECETGASCQTAFSEVLQSAMLRICYLYIPSRI